MPIGGDLHVESGPILQQLKCRSSQCIRWPTEKHELNIHKIHKSNQQWSCARFALHAIAVLQLAAAEDHTDKLAQELTNH